MMANLRTRILPLTLHYGWRPNRDLGTTGDYFVSPSGSDSNDGSFGAPFLTIQHAVDTAIAAGGQKTIRVRAGVYRETVSTSGWNGTSGAPQRILGYGTERPIITGANALTGWTQCGAGDAAVIGSTLGVASSPVWKATLPASSVETENFLRAYVIENGSMLPLAYDRNVDGDYPLSVNDARFFHDADSFGLNGSNQIVSATDADIIGTYTQAQLENMQIAYFRSPNWVSITPVMSASGSTVTIAGEHQQDGSSTRYQLLNALPNLSAGQWGYVNNGDNTVTFYIYPNNVENLTNSIEVISRNTCVDFGDSNYITIEGFEVRHTSNHRINVGQTLALTPFGVTIRDVYTHSGIGKGINAVYISDLTIEHVTVSDCLADFGVAVRDGSGDEVFGENVRILYCDFLRTELSAIQIYSQRDGLVAYCRMADCGYGAHANQFNAYLACDNFMFWGIWSRNSGGYATWQDSSNVAIGMCIIEGLGNRIVDQTDNQEGPILPSNIYITNNMLRGVCQIGALQSDQNTQRIHNNIFGNISLRNSSTNAFFDISDNLYLGTPSFGGSAGNTVSTPDAVLMPNSYFLAENSVANGLAGRDLDTWLNTWETLTGVDLHRDVIGQSFTTLNFVGPFAP